MYSVKIFQVGLMSNNSYLIYDKNTGESVVIDPSLAYNEISLFCKENNLTVSKVLLTHGHYDHIYDTYLFQRENAKVFAHKSSLFNINSKYAKHQLLKKRKISPQIDVFIEDNHIIPLLNDQIKVMHTPGHSECSCCFLLQNYIFSGDTLFKQTYGRYDFEDSSFDKLKRSLIQILTIPENLIVCPGHEDISSLDEEKKHNPILLVL